MKSHTHTVCDTQIKLMPPLHADTHTHTQKMLAFCIKLQKALSYRCPEIDAHTQVKLYCAVSALLIFSWSSLQQCVSYTCVCVDPHSSFLPWMLMEASDRLLGFRLAWPRRPSACSVFLTNTSLVSCLSVSLSLFSVSLTRSVVVISVLFSRLELPQLILLTLLYICIQTLKHFRIF